MKVQKTQFPLRPVVFRPTPLPHQSLTHHPFFPHTISTGLAPTRAEELLTFQLWPLDMLTVDDLCWCRCYVKTAPLRPHSAGSHLDCTQAGKTHWEALFISSPLSFDSAAKSWIWPDASLNMCLREKLWPLLKHAIGNIVVLLESFIQQNYTTFAHSYFGKWKFC